LLVSGAAAVTSEASARSLVHIGVRVRATTTEKVEALFAELRSSSHIGSIGSGWQLRIGRKPLDLDRAAILRDRQSGQRLSQLAKRHRASRATIHRVLHEEAKILPTSAVSKGLEIIVA